MFSFHDSRLLMCLILFITPKSRLTCPVMDNSPAQADPKLPGPSQPEHPQHKFFSTIGNKGGGGIKVVVGKDSESYGIYSLHGFVLAGEWRPGKRFIAQWPVEGITPALWVCTDATDKSMPTRDGECSWTQSLPFQPWVTGTHRLVTATVFLIHSSLQEGP